MLHRVVLPRADDPPEVRSLYLDEPETRHGHTAEVVSRSTVTLPPACQLSFATYFNAFPASYWKRWTRVEKVALRLTVRGFGRVDLYRSKSTGYDDAPQTRDRPQINVPARNARWFLLGMVDSATVSNADGSGVAFRKRDPQQFRALLARTITLYRQLVAEWGVTAERYRAAVPELTSVESWDQMFSRRGSGE